MSALIERLRHEGLLMATNNQHKIVELSRLLEDARIQVRTPMDLGLSFDVAETADTFQGNAALKARAGFELSGMVCLADDSGLAVDVLHGAPGVMSARFGEPGFSDSDRVYLLLDNLKGIPEKERTARFVCVLALCTGDAENDIQYFEGVAEGHITLTPRGSNGFGYDPVFQFQGMDKTFA
ncbi:MAG: non-canonical purine NTP pyrophosphatase, partial [Leptospiraceae bacterium]|nr:non-canonical purine NTP pyrophosphatase [Leptospiraceae bacterium]